MTIEELKNNPEYMEHHTASRRGYVSRKSDGRIEPYDGKFGKGYVILSPRWDTSQYVWITYYIKREEQANATVEDYLTAEINLANAN